MSTAIDQTLTDLLEDTGSLPPLAARIVAMTTDPGCTLAPLAQIINCDPAMTMRFLALANSASVYRGNPVRTLREALVRLGLRRTRDVAMLMGMHDLMPTDRKLGNLDPVAFWQYTLAVAATAQCLAERFPSVTESDAWLVGLLHGIGLPILARRAPAALAGAQRLATVRNLPLIEAETEVLGFHHGHIAARLMQRWHLPGDLAAAICADQGPLDRRPPALGNVLDLAQRFVRALGYGNSGDHDPTPDMIQVQPDLDAVGWSNTDLAGKVGLLVHEMSTLIDLDLSPAILDPALEISRQMAARMAMEGINDALMREEFEEDARRARHIQQKLMPQAAPSWPGYALAVDNLPGSGVSGDTYDFPPSAPGHTALMMADVAGKGIPAALLASNLQASVRALSTVISDPGRLLGTLNQALLETTDDELFATMFLAVLEPETGRLHYASAGHPPALLVRADGAETWLPTSSPPLGLLPGTTYRVGTVTLDHDDALILYTDGITEALDPRQQEFGRTRLAREVAIKGSESPENQISGILRAVMTHCSGQPALGDLSPPISPQDDMTLLILHRLTPD